MYKVVKGQKQLFNNIVLVVAKLRTLSSYHTDFINKTDTSLKNAYEHSSTSILEF